MKSLVVAGLMLMCAQLLVDVSYADDASVLPKGVFRAEVDAEFFFPTDERFGPGGKVENVAVDFNRSLNSSVFSALAALDRLVGGKASLGDSVVSFKYELTSLTFNLQYGLTDRVTLGVKIPYWWGMNKVKAQLNSGPGSSANVGLNPGPGPAIIPLARGGVPLTTEDVQQLLGPGLRGIPGFGFKRFETWSGDGLGDMEAGGRYQYFRTENVRLAFTGGVRFPTGRVDDPDNLTDLGFGRGAYALLFRLNNDYILSSLWQPKPDSSGRGELVLNGTFRYTLWLPDKQVKRVPSDVNNPLTTNKEEVSRDIGDGIQFEVSAKYTLLQGLNVSGLYLYGFKLEDKVSGTMGFAYNSLEKETALTEQIYEFRVSYSTVPLYRAKRFLFPLTASISYANRFAGSNNVLKAQWIGAQLAVFF